MPSHAESIITFDAYVASTGDLNTPAVGGWLDLQGFTSEDIFEDEGRATFTVPSPAPAALVADAFIVGRINGVKCLTFLVKDTVDVDLTEPDQMGVTATCALLPKIIDRGTVHPARGYGALPFSDTRVFSVFSPEFNIAGWITASAIVANQATASTYYTGKPDQWKDNTAVLIGPSNGTDHSGEIGQWWTQTDFTAAVDMNIVFDCAADNWAEVWLDGQHIGTVTGWGGTTSFAAFVKAGVHRIGAKVFNSGDFTSVTPPLNSGGVVTEGNPTFFLLSGFPVDYAGRRATAIVHTDTTWKIRSFLATAPGWTIGAAALVLFYENEAEGILPGVVLNWTAVNDSIGNPWPVHEVISVDVGRGLLDVLRGWATSYLDWTVYVDYAGAADIRVQLYNWTGSPIADSGVHFDHDAADPYVSTLKDRITTKRAVIADNVIVRWAGGFFREPAVGGYKQGFLKLAACHTEGEARVVAQHWLSVHGVVRTQVAASIAPNNADPLLGNIPYLHFNPANGIWLQGLYVRCVRVALTLTDGNLGVDVATKDWLGYVEDRVQWAIDRLSSGV